MATARNRRARTYRQALERLRHLPGEVRQSATDLRRLAPQTWETISMGHATLVDFKQHPCTAVQRFWQTLPKYAIAATQLCLQLCVRKPLSWVPLKETADFQPSGCSRPDRQILALKRTENAIHELPQSVLACFVQRAYAGGKGTGNAPGKLFAVRYVGVHLDVDQHDDDVIGSVEKCVDALRRAACDLR